MPEKLKVLAITSTTPDATTPSQTGSTNHLLQVVKLLDAKNRLTLLLPSPVHEPFLLNAKFRLVEFSVDNKWGHLKRFFGSTRQGIIPSMWHRQSTEVVDFLSKIKPGEYDICWLLEDYSGLYLRHIPDFLPVVFCRHFIFNMDTENRKNIILFKQALKHWYHRKLALRFDTWTTKETDATIVGTPESRENLLRLAPQSYVHYFPTKPFRLPEAIPEENLETSQESGEKIQVVYVGGMTFIRNLKGVDWFIHKVLPLLSPHERSRFHFKFIGKIEPEDQAKLDIPADCHVEFTGFVDELYTILHQAQMAIIPVFGGSGVRIKSVTLLGTGLPAVSTSDGIEGLPLNDGSDILIANDPEAFAKALRKLMEPEVRLELSRQCRKSLTQFISDEGDAEEFVKISHIAIEHHNQQGLNTLDKMSNKVKEVMCCILSRAPGVYADILKIKKNYNYEKITFLRLVQNGDVVFDIGANIGCYTLIFSHIVGKQGQVHAFEPIPLTFKNLSQNIMENKVFDNVYLNNTTVGDSKGKALLYIHDNDKGQSSMAVHSVGSWENAKSLTTYECGLIMLDDYAKSNLKGRLDFIKCDVEGAELLVLRGGQETIAKYLPIIHLEVHFGFTEDFNYHPADIIKLLVSLGYSKFYFIDKEQVRLLKEPEAEVSADNLTGTGHLLCIVPKLHGSRVSYLFKHHCNLKVF